MEVYWLIVAIYFIASIVSKIKKESGAPKKAAHAKRAFEEAKRAQAQKPKKPLAYSGRSKKSELIRNKSKQKAKMEEQETIPPLSARSQKPAIKSEPVKPRKKTAVPGIYAKGLAGAVVMSEVLDKPVTLRDKHLI
ncbi:MAG: hypothetical protein Q4E07_00310 [Eubacteriales bacterium]|nr:hypothetical protein [Eubacteriales bacterium]